MRIFHHDVQLNYFIANFITLLLPLDNATEQSGRLDARFLKPFAALHESARPAAASYWRESIATQAVATHAGSYCLGCMDDSSLDLRNTGGRLIKLAIAAAIGGVLTFFTTRAMMSSGHGGNADPVGASIMPLLGVFIFVVTTGFAHAIVSKKR